jgi:diaminohydroxyphosphoribosylaminopyrimidine deaminase/5-amino-6-(5-phosphoribosylamino)uracil reductase
MTPSPEAAAHHMAQALRLAERGRTTTHPNPRVGCVIVKDGVVIGEGFHARAGEPHAEVHALRKAGDKAKGADVFVTLEPCCHHGRTPPCTEALMAAGVRKVWVAMQDPNPQVAGQGAARLRAAGIEVEIGLMQNAALQLNRGFVSRMTRQRPFVTLKLAASLDGRTAMASGESQWITSDAARADVHRLRAEAGAVLTSSATVLADDPSLTVRNFSPSPLAGEGRECMDARGRATHGAVAEGEGGLRQPDRVILDAGGRVSTSAKVWAEDGARRVLITTETAKVSVPVGVEVSRLPAGNDGYPEFATVLRELGHLQINDVLIECGPRLAGLLLQAEAVDELVLYLAPCMLGGDARPLVLLPGLEQLSQRLRFDWRDVRAVGPDLRLTAAPMRAVVGPA